MDGCRFACCAGSLHSFGESVGCVRGSSSAYSGDKLEGLCVGGGVNDPQYKAFKRAYYDARGHLSRELWREAAVIESELAPMEQEFALSHGSPPSPSDWERAPELLQQVAWPLGSP